MRQAHTKSTSCANRICKASSTWILRENINTNNEHKLRYGWIIVNLRFENVTFTVLCMLRNINFVLHEQDIENGDEEETAVAAAHDLEVA